MKSGRRPRQIACLIHVALAGAGAAALGTTRDLSGPGAVRHFTLLALGVIAVLHVLAPLWPEKRRYLTVWAAGLLVVAGGIAALFGAKSLGARLGVVVVSASCLSCVINAAAMVWLLGPSGLQARRFSGRVLLALFVGLLGLAPTLAFRQLQAVGPALLGVTSVVALAVGASQLEAAVANLDTARGARIAGNLLTGVWLGLGAIAVASLAVSAPSLELAIQGDASREEAWDVVTSVARMSWLHTFPLVGAALVVFAGRLQLAGLAARPSLGQAFPVALVAAMGVLGGRHGLRGNQKVLADAVAISLPPARVARSAPIAEPAPAPSVPSSAQPEAPAPATSAEPIASAAPPPAPVGSGALGLEIANPTAILEADARSGIQRRFKLLEECTAKNPPAQPGTLRVKLFIDPTGSVTVVKPAGGELSDTPFAQCAMLSLYRMGFASKGTPASFELTLRATP